MDRSYIEYSKIVESFINRREPASGQSGLSDTDNHRSPKQADRDQRMKLAFLNVLREEMPTGSS